MKKDYLREYLTREAVVALLSQDELAGASLGEAASSLSEGQEYLDLEETVLGVRKAVAASPPLGRVLPRAAVPATTWNAIVAIVERARD